MTQNLLINKNKILTNCYNMILYVHETSEYYHYIHLYNFESNIVVYLYLNQNTIYMM